MSQSNLMSDHSWFRALACLIGGLLLAGCDGAMSCRQCEKRKEPERAKVDGQELVDALEEALGWSWRCDSDGRDGERDSGPRTAAARFDDGSCRRLGRIGWCVAVDPNSCAKQ